MLQQHIPVNNISSRILGDRSIYRDDLINSKTIADARTLPGTVTKPEPVFVGRHFANQAIDRDKFYDNCPAPDCATPTENFQIQHYQIADNAIKRKEVIGTYSTWSGTKNIYRWYYHIRGNAIIMDHIKDGNIVGRHIKDASVNSSKFNSSSVTSRSLATEAVTSQKIVDGTIKPVDFAPGSINGDHIQSTTVTAVNG